MVDSQAENPKLKAALLYASLGWHILPLHTMRGEHHNLKCSCGKKDCGHDKGKHPLGSLVPHGVSDATINEATIRRWWATIPDANVGIATGRVSGIYVVDVDVRNYGDEIMAALVRDHGALPQTPHVQTGGGGDHYYFRYPAIGIIPSCELAQGIDVQSDNAYVVAPPSNHQSGFTYEWEVSEHIQDIQPVEAPAWMPAMMHATATVDVIDVLTAEWKYDEPPVTLPEWSMAFWTGKHVIDITGEECPANTATKIDRSKTLFQICKGLHDAGVEQEIIAAAAANRDVALGYNKYASRWNGRAAREYNRLAAKTKVKYEDPNAPILKKPDSVGTTPVPAEEETEDRPANRWVPVPASMLDSNGERIDWIWEGYLARGGVTELVGLWKAGKTTLLAHLIHVMERGGIFAGAVVQKSRVLVITEEHSSFWTERRDEFGFSDHVHFICRPFLGKPKLNVWRQFIAHCANLVTSATYDAVFLDPLATLGPIVDENDAGEVTTAIVEFHRITEAGAGLLVSHHPNKMQWGQGMSSRGSGALPGFVDVLLEFGRYDPSRLTDTRRTIKGLSRFKETPFEVVIDLTEDGYVVVGTQVETRHADRANIILSLLSRIPVTAEAIRLSWPGDAAVPQPSTKTVLRDLMILVQAGNAVETGTGTKGDPRMYTLK